MAMQTCRSPSHSRGFAIIDVVIAMIVVTSAVTGCLTVLHQHSQSAALLIKKQEAMRLLERSRIQLAEIGSQGMTSVSAFMTLSDNKAQGLQSGTLIRSLGSQNLNQAYTVTWTTSPLYAKDANLVNAVPSGGCPYPLVKDVSILVSWKEPDGSMYEYRGKVTVSHPLLWANKGKYAMLDGILPSP